MREFYSCTKAHLSENILHEEYKVIASKKNTSQKCYTNQISAQPSEMIYFRILNNLVTIIKYCITTKPDVSIKVL